jgi:glutamine synthetase
MSASDVIKMIKDNDVKFVELRFTDTIGKEQHVTVPAHEASSSFFKDGKMFDGSSIAGWKGINESDMILMPDTSTAVIDPFFSDMTLNIRCDVIEPLTKEGYDRDPRSIAKKAEIYLKSTGIADEAYFGPEPEFFVFDGVRWVNEIGRAFYEVDSEEGCWSSESVFEEGNIGHRPGPKGGYFPVPPVDSMQDLRSAMCLVMEDMGVKTEVHHHEVATAGQAEIGTACNTLVKRADWNQILKYVVQNVAHNYGKTATFMPKPLINDNGNGMHVHQSLVKNGKNIFDGKGYGSLSDEALFYIGGIFKHAKALNAFTNSSTNSYKRLVPGFEAPTILVYSARNRSAGVRIPYVSDPKARRVEVRFPDSCGNPYFTFAALMMAGLDGIQNKIHPGDPIDVDLYEDLSDAEEAKLPHVCSSLDQALEALNSDRDFLKAGDVFTDSMIDGYITLKTEEVQAFQAATHPLEFEMYYSL